MHYRELLIEYRELIEQEIQLKREIAKLPQGNISLKNIHGKTYCYLQQRSGKKIISQYIEDNETERVKKQILYRKECEKKLLETGSMIKKVEQAIYTLEPSLYRNLDRIRANAITEAMLPSEMKKAVLFSDAMTSLEGIPASEEVNQSLINWSCGKVSFSEAYENTLAIYSRL